MWFKQARLFQLDGLLKDLLDSFAEERVKIMNSGNAVSKTKGTAPKLIPA